MSEELEIHPTHVPELDGEELYVGGKACLKCMYFIEFSGGRVTRKGAAPCKPMKIGLRMNAADHHAERFGRILWQ